MEYLYAENAAQLSPEAVQALEAKASSYWDLFYRSNRDRFYKDRHYIDREFADLREGSATVLEVGCGAGNTVYPLLSVNPQLNVYACDFAPSAVQLVREHPTYASGRISAFVADLTQDDLCASVPASSVDFVTMVFVLSAISPEHMPAAVLNVSRTLRQGGRLFFRDFAEGDLTEGRHQCSGAKRLGERFYVRGDGTRCYYFEHTELLALFAEAGFKCLDIRTHERDVENRKREITMHRRWVQAVFEFTGSRQQNDTDTQMSEAKDSKTSSQQQQQQHESPNRSGVPFASSGHGWLSGAAGRLASRANPLPGAPVRALLPDTLDSADELALTLSPDACKRARGSDYADGYAEAHNCNTSRPAAKDLEAELEAEFFATIQRDTRDVVAEELATAGFAGITLAGPCLPKGLHTAPTHAPASAPAPPLHTATHQPSVPHTQQPHTTAPPTLLTKDTVTVAGLCLSRLWPVAQGSSQLTLSNTHLARAAAHEVVLAALLARSSHVFKQLLANAEVLHIAAGPGALAAAAAVRVGARRVLVTHPERASLTALASSVHENRAKVVIERFKVAQLIMGQPDMLFNAAEQVAGGSHSSSTKQNYNLILCADLHTAVAAEAACMQQSQQGMCIGEDGTVPEEISSQALLAVLHGAKQLGGGVAALGDRGESACVAHARALSHAKKAGGVASKGDTASACSSVLLLLVPAGEEGSVASAAAVAGWNLDGEASGQLLQSLQSLEGAAGVITPLLFRSQT